MRLQHPSCTARAALRRASMTSVSWSVMPHYYQELDGFFWFEVGYRRMLQTLALDRPSVFVEIGSYQGKSTAFLGVEILNRQLPCTLHWVDCGGARGSVRRPLVTLSRSRGRFPRCLGRRSLGRWRPLLRRCHRRYSGLVAEGQTGRLDGRGRFYDVPRRESGLRAVRPELYSVSWLDDEA